MSKIFKEKNLIYVASEKCQGGHYTININNGVVISPYGREIKTQNRELKRAIEEYRYEQRYNDLFACALYEWFCYNFYDEDAFAMVQIADKIINMGYNKPQRFDFFTLQYVNDNMKAFSKWLVSDNANYDLELYKFVEWHREDCFTKLYAKYSYRGKK